MTHSRPAIRQLLDDRSLAPRRDLGQNFVADPNTVRRIADLARVSSGDRVVEIGAGLGSLTLALADTGAQVVAVEVDHGIVPILRQVVAHRTDVTVVEGDATTLDWHELLRTPSPDVPDDRDEADDAPGPTGGWVLVANLPYNVATPLVCDLLDDVPEIERMLVMVQREAAERFAASPRTPAYGAVSVKVAYWGTARIVGHVPASVFVPRPNVESSLVEIVRGDPPATAPEPLFHFVRTAFGQRRKMLRRSLAGVVDAATFVAAGIDPTSRPEELDVVAWCRLADAHTRSPADGRSCHAGSDPRVTTLRAHAKLTLSLRLTGVREDGFHLIDAEMVSLDLHDLLTIDATTGDTTVDATGPYATGVPTDASNLVARALRHGGTTAHVTIDKRIPHGGGLGGGSADAATVLRWAGVGTDDDALRAAATLGADIPFCMVGGRARVRGIGEVVDPLPHVDRTVTLVVPPLAVSTPAAYRAWDELGGPRSDGPNDLEAAAIAVEPALGRWRDRIAELIGEPPVLAGSGATWFAEGEHHDALADLVDEGASVVSARTVPAAVATNVG